MRALLDDPALRQDHQSIGGNHRAQPVGNHECGSSLHEVLERLLNESLRFGVERTRRLVEDEDLRDRRAGSSDRNALPLPTRELNPRSPTTLS